MTDILSTANVAGLLGISEGTLRYWRYMDEGPKSFRLGRHVKYRRSDVDEWLAAQELVTSRGGVGSQ